MYTKVRVSVLVVLGLFLFGCATTANIQEVSKSLDEYVNVLARDWPKASGAIRGGLGEGNIPKNIVDQMDEMDKLFQDSDGNWLPADQINLSDYDKYYIAFARMGHSSVILKVIIERYAPGLLLIPEVASVLTFVGF